MSMPFYVSPEQVLKDRADYARKNIARGRGLVATLYADGILLVGENPSPSLHKISELYDKIAFAAIGKYSEFDQLRIMGVRLADTRGFAYSREDVSGYALAKEYAHYLELIFTQQMKPMEVELLVAEVGPEPGTDELYHVVFDGFVFDEDTVAALGGESEQIDARLKERYQEGWDLATALKASVAALAGPDRTLTGKELEVAVLARSNGRRAFRRLDDPEVDTLLT